MSWIKTGIPSWPGHATTRRPESIYGSESERTAYMVVADDRMFASSAYPQLMIKGKML